MKGGSTLYAGVVALAPVLAATPGLAAPAPMQGPAFAAPAQSQVLTRVLRRALHDGKEIVATRRYRLAFEPLDDGYRVVATLIDIQVEAPPQLNALAEIERRRSDDAGFELRLDQAGQIVERHAGPNTGTRARLAATGETLIAAAVTANPERQKAISLLSQMLATMGTTALPVDVFNPLAPRRNEHRALTLPDGSQGAIDIELVAQAPDRSTRSRLYSRTVVTTLGGTRKVSREDYTLAPG